jgi:hypothetical protein
MKHSILDKHPRAMPLLDPTNVALCRGPRPRPGLRIETHRSNITDYFEYQYRPAILTR